MFCLAEMVFLKKQRLASIPLFPWPTAFPAPFHFAPPPPAFLSQAVRPQPCRPSVAFLCPPRAPPPQRPCVVPRLNLSLCAAVAAPAPPPLRPRGTADKGEERQTQSLAKTEVKTAARQSQRQKSHPPCHMPDCSDRAPPHNCSLLRTTWNLL